MRSSHDDGAFHVYLDATDNGGRVRYLSEGLLRARHRRYPATFLRADARPLVPGELTELRIDLLSTSVRIPAGWRLRLTLAGADADTFAHVPENGAPTITFERGPDAPSRLILPVFDGTGSP